MFRPNGTFVHLPLHDVATLIEPFRRAVLKMFVKIRGERHYLWRAVDQDGAVIDILVQRYRNARAATGA